MNLKASILYCIRTEFVVNMFIDSNPEPNQCLIHSIGDGIESSITEYSNVSEVLFSDLGIISMDYCQVQL